jgi:hypothetical protein
MKKKLSELVLFVLSYAAANKGCSKTEIAEAVKTRFALKKERSVFYTSDVAIRFSTAAGNSFSNVVLSLSALKKYDHLPFIVCIVRPNGVELLLSNATLLKKISHSSQQLRVDNVRGSFLGHDIMRKYEDIANEPKNFLRLYDIHSQFTWEENLVRLVENTEAIVPTGKHFTPSMRARKTILQAPQLASILSKSPEYITLYKELSDAVQDNVDAILKAGRIDNVNLRGNMIEQIISRSSNFHGVEDIIRTFAKGLEVWIDIKTKIVTLSSSPKGYNIDKLLKLLAKGNTVFAFFFVGLNVEKSYIMTCLVSIFDKRILNATRVQFHWAGRNSRGVTQLTGDLNEFFATGFSEEIDIVKAETFLQMLIDLKPTL